MSEQLALLPGYLAARVRLTLAALARNTVTGLHGVDAAVVEAARGLGMTPALSPAAAASRLSDRPPTGSVEKPR